MFNKCPKLKRSSSDVQNGGFSVTTPDYGRFYFRNSFRREKRCSQSDFKKSDECIRPDDNTDLKISESDQHEPFRCRASTDGTIIARPKRCPPSTICITYPMRRRMSISLRGSNSTYDD